MDLYITFTCFELDLFPDYPGIELECISHHTGTMRTKISRNINKTHEKGKPKNAIS